MLRHRDDLLRVLYVAAVVAVALFLGFWASVVLANIWTADRDGSIEAYLVIGGALGLAALALAVFVLIALQGAATPVRVASVGIGLVVAVASTLLAA